MTHSIERTFADIKFTANFLQYIFRYEDETKVCYTKYIVLTGMSLF